ncbi:MAG: protein translocase subunit SecF [Actinobacteria bacterium]|nr:protein translocase subunit SecF [Actinomycetota bacterium]
MKRPNVDFVGRFPTWIAISGALIVLSIAALAIRGLNLSIDFVGGTSFVLEGITEDVTSQELRDAAQEAGAGDVTAQLRLEDGEAVGALVRTDELGLGSDEAVAVQTALEEVTGAQNTEISFVGGSWGERISRKAVEALVVFLIVVIAYISIRLEFKMAVAAVIALLHDLFITVGLYALAGFNVSPSTVIALLTILGYSLYDSIVVFDRVKENATGPLATRVRYDQLTNLSMNEVLWRSINTSMTSLLPIAALLVIGSQVFGADTLNDLALALFIGMAIGAYSSLFVAGPFLAWWKMREPENQRLAERLAERSGGAAAPVAVAPDEVAAQNAPITTEYVRGRGKKKRRR